MKPERNSPKSGERGFVILVMAFAIVGLIGAGSLAVDIGSALVTKAELQNVSDASSLAGTQSLATYYKTNPTKIQADISSQIGSLRTTAQTFAELNKAGGISISVPDGDLLFGKYDPASGAITATNTGVRLVRVTSRRDDTANGVLPTRLARVLGINTMNARATTASALTPLGTLNAGEGDFPIGISKNWFDSHKCGTADTITLFPTSSTSCAGWHTFTDSPASANNLGNIIDGLKTGAFTTPKTVAGETFYNFIGGTVESKCSNLKELHEAKAVDGIMTANIPVYDFDCGNVNQSRKILGFVRASVSAVVCGSAKVRKLHLTVECGIVGDEVGSGGGPVDYGLIYDKPKMIY